MSLLLEALKKAEKAKEEAQRRERGEPEGAAPAAEPAPPEPAAPASPPPRPEPAVLTRDQLPDVRQPLMLEDDAQQPAKPAPAAPAPRRAEPRPDAQAAEREAQRSSARKVFEAKFKEPNPRLPFYISCGALGVFAVGTVIYFWLQLRPAPALVNTNPVPPAGETQIAAAELKPTPALAPPASAAPAIPGLPGGAPPVPAPAKPIVQAPVQAPLAPQQPLPIQRAPETPRLQAPPPRPAATEISSSRQAPQVHPNIATGYAAYVAGDLAGARAEYEKALKEEPSNRDAMLGLAALDVRAGRFETAEASYLRLLQADPRDSHALAALVALRAGRIDPLATESRVKSALADNPGSHVLNFTLGNQLAQQGRWAEAQQEYFKAYSAEPDNADFAYNLAVSLDHLRQPKAALDYYQRAIALARTRGARFDLGAAESRAAQLSR